MLVVCWSVLVGAGRCTCGMTVRVELQVLVGDCY